LGCPHSNFTAQTTVARAIVWSVYMVAVMGAFAGPAVIARPRRGKAAGVTACGLRATGSAVTVRAGDQVCETTATSIPKGLRSFKVTNTGSQVTEMYVYGAGDRIVGEIENIGPSTSRELIVNIAPGQYEIACKPGMTGKDIRQTLKVTGASAATPPISAQPTQAVVGYRRSVAAATATLVATTTPFVAAIKADDIPLAKRRYAAARAHYERIEPIVRLAHPNTNGGVRLLSAAPRWSTAPTISGASTPASTS
jgi:iron uptake system EfeUOB component EfeO/EfeM